MKVLVKKVWILPEFFIFHLLNPVALSDNFSIEIETKFEYIHPVWNMYLGDSIWRPSHPEPQVVRHLTSSASVTDNFLLIPLFWETPCRFHVPRHNSDDILHYKTLFFFCFRRFSRLSRRRDFHGWSRDCAGRCCFFVARYFALGPFNNIYKFS